MKKTLMAILIILFTLIAGCDESSAPNSRVISHVNPGLDSGGSAML